MSPLRIKVRSLLWGVFVLVLGISQLAQSETIAELESELAALTAEQATVQVRADSLKQRLDELTRQIEQEKAQPSPDRGNLESLLAQALTVSDHLDATHQQQRHVDAQVQQIKTELDQRYTAKIDSLRAVQQDAVGDKSRRISVQIAQLTEQRLRVSPRIAALSFDPQKIAEIDLTASDDTLQNAIFMEYLSRARQQIHDYQAQLSETRQELSDMALLQEKTDEFMADVDDDRSFGFFTIEIPPDDPNYHEEGVDIGSTGTFSLDLYWSQLQTVQQLSQQLRPPDQAEWIAPADSSTVELSLEEYLTLFDQLQRRLAEIDTVIVRKLEQAP